MHLIIDTDLTNKNNMLTLKIDTVEKNKKNQWTHIGPKRILTLSDCIQFRNNPLFKHLKNMISDELSIRRKEGRFYSDSDDISILRIPNSKLTQTIKQLQNQNQPLLIKNRNIEICQCVHYSKYSLTVDWIHQKDSWTIKVLFKEKEQHISFRDIHFILDSDPVVFSHENIIYFIEQPISMNWVHRIKSYMDIEISDSEMKIILNDAQESKMYAPVMNVNQNLKLINAGAYPRIEVHYPKSQIKLLFNYTDFLIDPDNENLEIIDYQKGFHIKRNQKEEDVYHNDLKNLGCQPIGNSKSEYYIPSIKLTNILRNLQNEAWEIFNHDHKPFQIFSSINYKLNYQNGHCILTGEVKYENTQIPIHEIVDTFKQKKSLYQSTETNEVFLMPIEWLKSNHDLWNELIYDEQNHGLKIKPTHFHRINQLGLTDDTTKDPLIKKLINWFQKNEIEINNDTLKSNLFCGSLRDYQTFGVHWIHTMYRFKMGGILADDMGLGKTIQAIAFLTSNELVNHKKPNLIIMPRTLIHNWIHEFEKFAPDCRWIDYSTPERNQIIISPNEYCILLTTYHILRNDIDHLKSYNFNSIILDESQVVKNYKTQTYEAVQQLNYEFLLSMTGTPLENDMKEIWAQFELSIPGLLGNLKEFKILLQDEEKKVKKIIQPFILRRKKDEVLKDLPPLTEQIIYCDMNEAQSDLYRNNLQIFKKEFNDPEKISTTFHILQALTKLRQICCHPILIGKDIESGKFEQILDMIDEIITEGHKCILFSQFTSYLKLFSQQLDQANIKYSYLDGKTKNREQVVFDFQNNSAIRLFLISLKAGGVGLNLTEADYVFIVDPWWNPQVEKQAIDRAYRIGQTKKVHVYRFITADTIEEKIKKLQQNKLAIFENFIDDQQIAGKLSYEDLKHIFD